MSDTGLTTAFTSADEILQYWKTKYKLPDGHLAFLKPEVTETFDYYSDQGQATIAEAVKDLEKMNQLDKLVCLSNCLAYL